MQALVRSNTKQGSRRLQIDMNVGNLASPVYLRRQSWRDLGPGAEVLAWASSGMVSSSLVSGLQTADLQCDLKPHSDNPVSRDLACSCGLSRGLFCWPR